MNLSSIQNKLRKKAKEILSNGEVEVLIGYGQGSIANKTRPVFIDNPEHADILVFNEHCNNNLAVYLKKFKPKNKKIGIVTKACDNRTLTALIKEKQIERDKIYIIGVSCYGMASSDNIISNNILDNNCMFCEVKTPIVYDVLIDIDEKDKSDILSNPKEGFTDEEIAAFEKLSPKERWEFFKKEVQKCIRCYACRNACPLCYCEVCFVDSSSPKWIFEGLNTSDLTFYHLVRILHSAGRCGECGACERACPMHIRLKFLTRKMNDVIEELFGSKSYTNPDEPPSLGTFKENDNNTIFK